MHSIFEFFKGNPWLNMIFFLLAIISIVLAIIFYYKSLKTKEPVFSKKSFHLVDNTLSTLKNIEIKYGNTLIKNLTVTKFAFWNSGKESIRESDIAETDPLIICTNPEAFIYDFEILYHKSVNNIRVTKLDERKIEVSFDFLDLNDGIVLNIYHSGRRSDDLSIKGTLIGAKKIKYGIKRDFYAKKIDFISRPLGNLVGHKIFFIKLFSIFFLMIPAMLVLFPLFAITIPFDFLNDRVINRTPKEFYFYDE